MKLEDVRSLNKDEILRLLSTQVDRYEDEEIEEAWSLWDPKDTGFIRHKHVHDLLGNLCSNATEFDVLLVQGYCYASETTIDKSKLLDLLRLEEVSHDDWIIALTPFAERGRVDLYVFRDEILRNHQHIQRKQVDKMYTILGVMGESTISVAELIEKLNVMTVQMAECFGNPNELQEPFGDQNRLEESEERRGTQSGGGKSCCSIV